MADAKKSQKPQRDKLISPKGIAVFPHLTKPDTKFAQGGAGHYTVRLRFTQHEVQPFLDKLDKYVDDAFAKAVEANDGKTFKIVKGKKTELVRKEPYTILLDDNTGDPTGDVEVMFKMKAEYKDKNGVVRKLKPTLVDGRGNEVKKAISIFGGSILKVDATPVPYDSTVGIGLTMYMNAVQIIKLQTGSSGGHNFEADDEAEYEYDGHGFDSDDSAQGEESYEPGSEEEPEDTPDF